MNKMHFGRTRTASRNVVVVRHTMQQKSDRLTYHQHIAKA